MRRVLLFPVRILWKIFSRVVSALIIPFSAVAWIVQLIPHIPKMAVADEVILMTNPTGFGHSVMGPDAMRRLYKGKRCLFLVTSWLYEHNQKVGLLWPDIDVAFISRFLAALPHQNRVVAIPFLRWHDAMAIILTRGIVAVISRGQAHFQTLYEMYLGLQKRGSDPKYLSDEYKNHADGVEVTAQWQLLQKNIKSLPLRLPQVFRDEFNSRLEQAWTAGGHTIPRKMCCLYLRYEERDANYIMLRNSSSLENHLPAVRHLNEAGYQVLLTGDFKIEDATKTEFKGGVVNAEVLGADHDLFQLFAASEADIFIGNHGGGDIISVSNGIPSLYIDWFPYSHGRRNAWFYYKSARDENGEMIPGKRLITDFVHDTAASFGTLLNNTQEEITDAVACFIEDVNKPGAPDPYADVAALIPKDTNFHAIGARLSPAWVRRNILNEGGAKGVLQ
jgi:putative glycosyltransferase (TIGR04372 family)